LDRWVLQRACHDAVVLRAQEVLPGDARMSVNISAKAITETDLYDRVLQTAASARLPLKALELEVTETGLMSDARAAGRVLAALRELGVGIALDDFGTGYSSLTYVRQLPVTTIKIDRSFVRRVVDRAEDLAITASIVDLGRAVGVRTIAEGVETVDQLTLLNRLGCEAGQGFLWSVALPREELAALLKGQATMFLAATNRDDSGSLTSRPARPVTNEHGLHRILLLHREGASLITIAASLNNDGYRTPVGLRWHSSSVARAITDVVYDSSASISA
jgi:EAL domain-containing protein (putative c-di-GMP-specific phosphodiesterase class I)